MTATNGPLHHIFTVDVEEYFQVGVFDDVISRDRWDEMPSRVDASVDLLLEMLARHEATGTFFTLGWLADRRPGLVRRIVDAGHELASHGWWHRRVTSLTPEEFRRDVRDSRALLEDVSGTAVLGYRAPNFSITPACEWAFDVLVEEGYRYDSSVFPIRRPGYGYPDAPPVPYLIKRPAGTICELPLATTQFAGVRFPAAGGAYLRHLPMALTERAFREFGASGIPGTFYIHPWEIDPAQPRIAGSLASRIRHYSGLNRTAPRLERLLSTFRFTSVVQHLGMRAPVAPAARVSALPK
jgi:polysaccharide deacetylase family protein (PEP-CTERM system associated)